MPESPPPAPSDVVRRLRAAGCVFAESEARLLCEAAGSPAELDAMVERRAAGEPLEHVVGWAELCGLRIAVGPGVFVPRRRTELLAERVAALATPGAVVVDLGCGAGAIGAVVLARQPGVELHAVDIEPAAVACACRNLGGLDARVYAGDLFAPLPVALRGRIDVLVANGPYVPTDEIRLLPAEAREHEPRVTLDGGADGLRVLRRVVGDAPTWLAPGGSVLVETSAEQAPALVDIVTRAGLDPRVVHDDGLDATVVVGTRPAPLH